MKERQQWYVYIIENEKGLLYTGITTDLERRFNEHLSGHKGAKFFNSGAANKMLYCEEHPDRSSASKREAQIKKMKRPQKLTLIAKWCETTP